MIKINNIEIITFSNECILFIKMISDKNCLIILPTAIKILNSLKI